MTLSVFLLAAALLSLERICYLYISRAPDRFCAFCNRPAVAPFGEPVDVLQKLCYGFKVIQFGVFFGWCYVHGHASPLPPGRGLLLLGIGGALIVAGQILNFGVFYRLGKVGVFYGNKLGHDIPWCRAFPFSWLKHPQYVGTVGSIWGFFLIMRFPHNDWYMLPALETVYYMLGAYFER
jgi:phosphatidyl-N-methylethanolamine N-methyltransferase